MAKRQRSVLALFAPIVAFLAGFTFLRLGDVQSIEIVLAAALFFAFLLPQQGGAVIGARIMVDMVPRILLMFFLLACGSFLSMRLHFYPPNSIGLLRLPPWGTFIRLIEIVICVSALFVVGFGIRGDPRRLKVVLAAYAYGGFANAIWGIIALAAHYAGIELPGITRLSRIPRMSGFFVEGGPLGVYLTGVALIQYIRGPVLGYISRPAYWGGMALILIGIVGSQSKAAALVLVLLMMLNVLYQRRAALVVLAAVLIVPMAVASNLVEGLGGYYHDFANFRQEAYERANDPNLLNGRLMASVILPRIVAAHPVLGVGIGNYGLVRNDPDFLLGLPRTELWDLQGLGLLGYLAELGIPLTIFVLYIYAYPLLHAWRSRPWIFLLSSYPVLAALFGVQLNFAYPWVVMGIALSVRSIEQMSDAGRLSAPPAPRVPQLRGRRPPARPQGAASGR